MTPTHIGRDQNEKPSCVTTGRLTLDKLRVGQSARVLALSAKSDVRHRLMEMGLLRGARVRLIRFAPMGDPIDVEVRGYHLSLRKRDAHHVEVELMEAPVPREAAVGAMLSK